MSKIKLFEIVTINSNNSLICSFSIHPRYKHDVGYRLSRSGLAVAYGQQVEFQGPIVQNITYLAGNEIINITYTAVSSIELRNPNGFEVCTLGFLKIFKEFNVLFSGLLSRQ